MRSSTGPHPRLLLALAFAGARGVTVPGVAGYAALWALIGLVSRFSMSALGLQFAPAGSSSLDTVAVVFMLLPAAALTSSTTSRTPEFEAGRSRAQVLAQSVWVFVLVGLGTVVAWATSFTLHGSVDRNSYFSAWFLVFSVMLIAGAFATAMIASMCTLAVVAAFSTPGLVPWQFNLMYNVAETRSAAVVGVVLLVVGGCLQVVRSSRPSGGSV